VSGRRLGGSGSDEESDGDGSVVEELGCCCGVLQVWLAVSTVLMAP